MTAVDGDWTPATVDDLVTHETEGAEPSDATGLRYVGLEHIDPGEMSLHRWGDPASVRSRKTRFRPGDILYGKLRPYLDKAVLAEESGICSTDILVLRARPDVDPYFATAVLHTRALRAHAVSTTTGVNHPRTSWGAIRRHELLLPALPEQRAIAHVLRTVQRAKEATEQVIGAARELKKSLMRHLFRYGPVPVDAVAAIQTTNTPIGDLPADWEVRPLGDLARYVNGYAFNSEHWGQSGRPIIRIQNLTGSGNSFNHFDGEIDKRYLVLPGDILVSWSASLGVFKWDGPEAWLNQHIFKVTDVSADVEPEFLRHALDHQIGAIRARVHGSTMKHVTRRDFLATPVPLPDRDQQLATVGVLTAIEEKVGAEEARRDALASLFDSLLADLMTARLRVTDLKVPA